MVKMSNQITDLVLTIIFFFSAMVCQTVTHKVKKVDTCSEEFK